MTTIDLARGQQNDRLFGANITAAVAGVIGHIAAWNNARMTRSALSRLTDRELDDIGLSRGDIENLR